MRIVIIKRVRMGLIGIAMMMIIILKKNARTLHPVL